MLHAKSIRWCQILLLFLWHCTCVRAQDVSFRQAGAAPQLINPALTAAMDGQYRITANYQTLFTGLSDEGNYRSVAVGAERKFNIGKHHFAGAGVQLQHDRAGSSDFVRTQVIVGGAYRQRIGGDRRGHNQYLTAGAQIGAGQRGYDMSKIWFSEQYFVDPASRAAYLDRTLPSGEPFTGAGTQWYLDLNTGLAYLATLGARKSLYLGISAYHLTRPDVSPQPVEADLLQRRYTVHGGGELPLGDRGLSLLPSFRYAQQGPSYLGQVGGYLRYTEREWREVALRVGTMIQLSRQQDNGAGVSALVVGVGLETEGYQIGVTYDLAVGALGSALSGRGGFELGMIYTGSSDRIQHVRCPKF